MAEYIDGVTGGIKPLFIIVLVVVIGIALILAVDTVGTIPLTQHAENSHQSQPLNATSLIAMIAAGACRDIEVYECPIEQTIKIICKVGETRWGGLIIGTAGGDNYVITGYESNRNHWDNKVKGCRYTGVVMP